MQRLALVLAAALTFGIQTVDRPSANTPATLDQFQAAAMRVMREAGIPGAGISLVRADGVEWEGGLGLADRDRQTPVTADTHFRVGSISKSFVAIAVMQLYYEDRIELEAPLATLAPEVSIDNQWQDTDPVRVIHLLQHTAGFDDMHFNQIYNLDDSPSIPLLEVLKRGATSRTVRWRPGTRMSYSNPGYAVAGYLIEKQSGEPYEDHIEHNILGPLGMNTSSFRLTTRDQELLAQGYKGASGGPAGFPQIYLRPAGNLHSSAHEMGRFVRMLLNWGELDGMFVIDPEYLGNMERSSTSIAAEAGLRNTYGSGIGWNFELPFPVLGHGGSIEGFTCTYGYSPSRDVGYVILLNSGAPAAVRAMDQLAALSIRFLKRDVDAPSPPEANVDPRILSSYNGYYEDANPRNQIMWPVQRLITGRTISAEGHRLIMRELTGRRTTLVPVSETTFRRDRESDATLVFARDASGITVLTGNGIYAERRPRWQVELIRAPVIAAVFLLVSPLIVAIAWVAHARRARPRGFWLLKSASLTVPLVLCAPVAALTLTPLTRWGQQNAATIVTCLSTIAVPAVALLIAALALAAHRQRASGALVAYASLVAAAALGLSVYLYSNNLMALRLWAY
ncbi:MAG TPA: serine hydrolase domain-containing protein [Vicinamibacterales bacterium]|nr:serine hydrolase domain-containing protein [Vicinamibacterales bacterium]